MYISCLPSCFSRPDLKLALSSAQVQVLSNIIILWIFIYFFLAVWCLGCGTRCLPWGAWASFYMWWVASRPQGLSGCGAWAALPPGIWDSSSPKLEGRFLTTGSPQKPPRSTIFDDAFCHLTFALDSPSPPRKLWMEKDPWNCKESWHFLVPGVDNLGEENFTKEKGW